MAITSALSALSLGSVFPEKLKKAKIQVLNSGGSVSKEIEVLFNPSEYVLTDSARYNELGSPQTDGPLVSYHGGNAATLSMNLFFDTSPVVTTTVLTSTKARDVSKVVSEFTELVYIKKEVHAPPQVKFVWGSLSFLGVVTQIQSTYTKFMESGMPVQARVQVSFMAVPDKNRKRKAPFESPDRTKYRMVREDWSIWDIARSEYGDPSKWRIIAQANGLSDPLSIAPGTMLKVPAL